MKRAFVFFYSLFLLSFAIYAQDLAKAYQFFKIKENISNIGVCNITQDQYGFIWIGTNGAGLNKFDGIDYTTYKHQLNDPTSLSSSLIFCSYLDNENRLWFGTEEGLNLYDRRNDCFKRIPLKESGTEKKNISIRSLAGDKNGNLFIGTSTQGLFILNLKTFKVEKAISQENNSINPIEIHALVTDANGTIYAGTNWGLKEYDEKTNTLKLSLIRATEGVHFIKEAIQSLVFDAHKNLWIGSVSKGVYRLKIKEGSIDQIYEFDHYEITENRVLTMVSLPDKSLLCGTENDGLIHMDANGKVIKHYLAERLEEKSILSNSIWNLFLDRNERIWVGYYNAGIDVYDKLYDKFNEIESLHNNNNSLEIGSVTAIVKDDLGNFWISMDGGGIDVVNPKLNRFRHINANNNDFISGLTDDYIESLFIDSNKNLWAGTWNKGIYLLKKGSKKFINFNMDNTGGALNSNNFLSIDEDSSGTIWFTSWDSGLHSYNPETNKFMHHTSAPFLEYQISNCDARKVLVDKNDNIWLGTVTHGLFKINKTIDGTFIIEPLADRMASEFNNYTTASHVLSLYESNEGPLWIGTRGAGLCKFDLDADTFTWYNRYNGFTSDNVTGIVEDVNNNIWVSSNSGISKLDPQTNTIKQYTSKDGLLSNDYNINATYKDESGRIYFGNYLGIDYFNPLNITTNRIRPSLYLTGFKLFNKTVVPNQNDSPLQSVIGETNSITLNNAQSVFTIEYTGVNYTRPEKNQYAYYLEGLEQSWNYVGDQRSATYTNLAHGKYTFKLKSANSDGVWNETPLELEIIVLPPWWKTNEALFGYVLLLLLGIYYLNRTMQMRLNKKQEKALEQNIRLQEKALNEKKFQFFTNISHEFRTPLTLIMNPIDDIIRDETLNLPLRVREKHNIIYKNTSRLYRLINELLDFRKLELNKVTVRAKEIDLVSFTKDIMSYFKEETLSKDVHLNMDADFASIPIWADERMLEKIIFNILSNAVKITPNGGAINVDIKSTDELLMLPLVDSKDPVEVVQICISDTGSGIEEEELKKIFERFYQSKSLNKGYYGGTGIGLEVVREFVNLHKGKVDVSSKVGEGTTFKIILPIGNAHFKDDEIVTEEAEIQKEAHTFTPQPVTVSDTNENGQEENLTKHTLLIVEDNEELLSYLRKELSKDYKIKIANNGKKGLQMAKKVMPDVIITDVIMPEMDGLEFCKQIKSDIGTSHIPVLMLTAKAKIDDRMEGIETGADAYMVKPFNIRLLKLRLAQLITSRQLIFNKYFSVISEIPEDIKTTPLDKEFIENVLNHINDNIGDPNLNVEALASQLNLSRSQFYRKIKALTNQTANEFLRNIRLQKARQILEMGETNISKVCYATGFSSHSYFTKCFKNYFGDLPTEVKPKSNN
ncbi:hybrid sensor histidine kinase/response regulator transcription factor [Seonamhaeicola sp.]|uniref:hybrid sensor histidine kinase/response regulator transcription factor n=1 Tax=Seonamhaeicola sp. TaxID=1912245 RepID=UPI00260CFE07|nr:hybrid sensor histidine kinase/response regulator transcription factor [Seonamhaeicola sp.]